VLSPIDAKTFDAKTPSKVLNCVPLGMAGVYKTSPSVPFGILKKL
jgi:hypothetical protein